MLAHTDIDAMAGGQVIYEFGYCPYDFNLYRCAVTVRPFSQAWNMIGTYAAVKRLLTVSNLAVAFPLKSMSQPAEEYTSNAMI